MEYGEFNHLCESLWEIRCCFSFSTKSEHQSKSEKIPKYYVCSEQFYWSKLFLDSYKKEPVQILLLNKQEKQRTSLLHFINTELISLLKTKIVKVSNLSCRKHNRNNSKRSISEDNIEQKYYLESQTLPKQAPWDFLLWERPSSWRFC